jgi:tetratricopeptide (TPR) repeat protein
VSAALPDSLGSARALVASLPAALVLLHAFFGTLEVGERYGDSQVLWAHAASLYPNGGFTTGNACATQRDPARAVEVCRHAQRLQPNSALASMRLVEVLSELGRLDDAEAELAAARKRPGASWPLWLAEGRLALRKQELPRAHAAFAQVLVANPGHVEARVYLADVRLRLGLPRAGELVATLPRASDPITQRMLESVRARLPRE